MTALGIHGTAVALGPGGLLLLGAPGAGKSDLALRLVDRGARLVADDLVLLRRRGALILAGAPAGAAGQVEARGLGIVHVAHCAEVELVVAVELGEPAERLPAPRWWDAPCGGSLPLVRLSPWPASAPILAESALARARAGTLWQHDAPHRARPG